MRFSTSSILLALPLLSAAAEAPFEEYKAQFQNFLGNFGSYIPNPNRQDPVDAAAARTGDKKLHVLTLDNWKQTVYSPVKPAATTPEEWWVLSTGRNKTCFGHCLRVEAAFNETATKFATLPKAPHMAYLNCDDQPILCNSWSASPATLWIMELLPAPAKTDIYIKRMNITTATSQDFVDIYESGSKENFKLYDGYFHPFDGPLAQYGVAVPIAYILWILNVVPSWGMMLIISFFSRSMMSRRMQPDGGRAPAAAAGAGGATR